MPDLTLFFAPDTCARVPLTALEEIGCDYRMEVITFMKGQHRSDAYLALNPKGKVPTLVIDGRPLTENVAILSWLSEAYPEANLLPTPSSTYDRATVLSDLAFCASGLHPIVTRLRIPLFFCDLPEGAARVFDMAATAMTLNLQVVERRLAESRWWYGEDWSLMDAYINWVWFRITGTRFDSTPFPSLARHDADMKERPAVQRALAIGRRAADDLAAQGLAVQFDGPGAVAPASR